MPVPGPKLEAIDSFCFLALGILILGRQLSCYEEVQSSQGEAHMQRETTFVSHGCHYKVAQTTEIYYLTNLEDRNLRSRRPTGNRD